jgi:hypothetical protein
MNAALRALLTGLIDYAGLFPPAKLPMDEAVRNYLRYRDEPEAWMLGRFICPASRLGELEAYHGAFGDRPIVVSALGRGGETTEQLFRNLDADLNDVNPYRKTARGRVVVDVLETRVPAVGLADPGGWEPLFAEIDSRMTPGLGGALFVEVPVSEPRQARPLLAALKKGFAERRAGYKMRCGGLEASAFPTSEQIAAIVSACLTEEVPFKATAGLHHPLPRFDEGVNARMHGFANLFAAGVLSRIPEDIQKILEDDDPAHFLFHDGGMSWGPLFAPVEAIRQARQEAMISFGSCSFDEPRDDLRALGWL